MSTKVINAYECSKNFKTNWSLLGPGVHKEKENCTAWNVA